MLINIVRPTMWPEARFPVPAAGNATAALAAAGSRGGGVVSFGGHEIWFGDSASLTVPARTTLAGVASAALATTTLIWASNSNPLEYCRDDLPSEPRCNALYHALVVVPAGIAVGRIVI
jgi:hypothetical protein